MGRLPANKAHVNREHTPAINVESVGVGQYEIEEIMLGREEDEAETEILRDRFRLSTISIAEEEARNNGVEMSEPIIVCIADLAFKYAEQLAKDLECFAQHANRKTVNMEDVILAAHRNENLATMLRSFCNDLKGKEPRTERKRKKPLKKDELASTTSVQNVADV